MSEILLHLGLAVVRFFIGLYEFFGFLFEADFWLTNGIFSSTALAAIRSRVRHRGALWASRRRLSYHSISTQRQTPLGRL